MKKIVIVDYGLGNIVSAQQSFVRASLDNKISSKVIISNNPGDIEEATHVVLPGQGAFKSCMDGLKKINGMISSLEKSIMKNKKPFLGICVGMQLLADSGLENGTHKGLGWIEGTIKKLEVNKLKLPHMGWNTIKNSNQETKIKFDNQKDFYFVHSYYFDCLNVKNVIAYTNYGINFPSIVNKENVYGVQFHPEKSSKQGLNLIKNFLSL
jgi:glutamine amidotransferase|tara:strand:- start:265 stop:894 length:630 start_codon:yes stop_codon:yes gene_type:complete